MIRIATLFWLILSSTVFAQTVVVKSGDHPGFTRLVLELPKAADWQMGRTAQGYVLRIPGESLRFDVTNVFKDIKHDRLAAIWMDPASGALQLGIACACHALPFEFRPGIIVIDLRDGPPPKGSSFESTLDGTDVQSLAARPTQRPRARPRVLNKSETSVTATTPVYDWRASGRSVRTKQPVPAIDFVAGNADVGPLKDALLLQLSRGAAQGIVQMSAPSLASRSVAPPALVGPRANIRLGEAPGFSVLTKPGNENTLIEGGVVCISDESLDVAGWGSDQSRPAQLADSRVNLVGEFDAPNPDAVTHATKLLLNWGFGAEAQQLLSQMPVDDPDAHLWAAMAKIVDGAPDANSAFSGMQTCDTAAALWATLAMPQVTAAAKTNSGAVLRAFSALPVHLRRSLGPELVAKFLAINNMATARSIGNSVRRGLATVPPEIVVMDANIELAAGHPAASEAQLLPALANAGTSTAAALVALVDARIASGEKLDPATTVALAALVREQAGSDQEPALRRAQILALGSSGDFDQAFSLLPQMAEAERDLWQLLATSGSDTAILNHAVLPAEATLPALSAADRSRIAAHLLTLGLPDAAQTWIGETSEDTDRQLAAQVALSNGDPDTSLALLAGLNDNAAAELKAAALWRLGKAADAAIAWAQAGNSEAELRAQSWARNWKALSKNDTSSWQQAAALMTAAPSADVTSAPGPLALGIALVTDSISARTTLATLLANVAGPKPAE